MATEQGRRAARDMRAHQHVVEQLFELVAGHAVAEAQHLTIVAQHVLEALFVEEDLDALLARLESPAAEAGGARWAKRRAEGK